ncbi:MAG: PHP domain-containing protein [Clostridium sp.]|uniref:PHP domain-containing protein n=1 Tax=Clostridium sp. TaxID=1506 RepID=UPI003F381CA7
MKKIDLHIHSTGSDGKFTPTQIVSMAKVKGLSYISITDHNSIDGLKEGIEEGEKIGIRVIPGIELSTRYKGKQVHLLGYFKGRGYEDKKFLEALEMIKKKKLGRFNSLFKGKIKIQKNKKRLDVENGIKFLRMFGAVVFIAHPGKIKKEALIEILKFKVNGIEAIHPRHTKEDVKYFKGLAKEKKIKYSAGSDFHRLDENKGKHGVIGDIYREVDELKDILSF